MAGPQRASITMVTVTENMANMPSHI